MEHLKPIFDNFLPYLYALHALWDLVPSAEIIISVLWLLAWATALGVGIWQLDVVWKDWRAILFHNVQNGRRLIAWGNLRTMRLLVGVSALNLTVGIIVLFLIPPGWITPEGALLINRTCLLISAWMVTAIILGKRHDRARWESRHHEH